jgi:hypothetical protein
MSIRARALLQASCLFLLVAACNRYHEGQAAGASSAGDPNQPGETSDVEPTGEISDPEEDVPAPSRSDDEQLGHPVDAASPSAPSPPSPRPPPGEERFPIAPWDEQPCARTLRTIHASPTHLAFVLDASHRMGRGDVPWHDRLLKWDPVVRALRGFFTTESARGVSASLTLYPSDGGDERSCAAAAYEHPDLVMSELPSASLATALDALSPASSDAFREGTPLAAALAGTHAFLAEYKKTHAGGFAIVLITDDEPPALCTGQSDALEAANEQARLARATGIPTYVIGLKNSPEAPTASVFKALNDLAVGSGTHQAHALTSGDPGKTEQSLAEALAEVRAHASSCALPIPTFLESFPRSSQTLRVRQLNGDSVTQLVYDPDCTQSNAWHFEDLAARKTIVLCEQTCQRIHSQSLDSQLQLDFACVHPIAI